MPHSPRWHDGRLWMLNSGAGELLLVDPESGRFDVVCRLPGYLRGLCFHGPYALVGLSKIRERHIFGGLPVQQRCEKLLCGIAVVDVRNGREAGFFEFTAGCEELYDVAVPAGGPSADDPEPAQAGGTRSGDQPRLVLLAAAEQ